ncbi:MAG: hypothetical protein KKC20_18610 [Proteobacteria bacterium]|nr:hypothetical protein [Pseudomonadota bacterium]
MKKIIGGALSIVFGFFCFSAFPSAFFSLLKSLIPAMLILGGCLALYLNKEEISIKSNDPGDGVKGDGMDDTPLPVPSGEAAVLTDDSHEFVGNTVSGIFHNNQCPYATGKNCTTFFPTGKEAVQAGYKPCGICKP